MDKSKETNQPQRLTPTTTDDESITTSTASDTLDSWTLVTDKKNPKPLTHAYEEEESNVEDLPKYEDLDLETSQSTAKEEQETEPTPEHIADTTSATDEFSDEVSIISESESGDVQTPHPYLREHLHTLNLKFTTGEGIDLASLLQQQQQEEHRLQQRHESEQTTPPNTPIQYQQRSGNYQLRQRKKRSPSLETTQKTLETQANPPVPLNDQTPCHIQPPLIIRRVYTLFFYSIVAITLIGLYGKLGFLEWPMFSSDPSKSFNALEKKLIDMELQNNLMRAEIDLLTKQVNYMKTQNPTIQNDDWNNKRYQPKNGKKPYLQKINRETTWGTYESIKEQENSFTDNTADQPNVEHINTASIHTVSDNDESYQSSPKISEFESETNPPVTENFELPVKQIPSDSNDNFITRNQIREHDGKKEHVYESTNDNRFRKRGERGENFKRQNKKYNSKEHDEDNGGKRKNFKRESKERFNEKDNSKERIYRKGDNEHKRNNNDNNNSKERNEYNRNNNDKDSKERYRRKDYSKERNFKKEAFRNENPAGNVDNSKEQFRRTENFKKDKFKNNQKKKFSDEQFHKEQNSGEWHWMLMKQRENARNENEERLKHDKNWYLNQKDGREQWRSEEMKRR